jgi:hypothetical protein
MHATVTSVAWSSPTQVVIFRIAWGLSTSEVTVPEPSFEASAFDTPSQGSSSELRPTLSYFVPSIRDSMCPLARRYPPCDIRRRTLNLEPPTLTPGFTIPSQDQPRSR